MSPPSLKTLVIGSAGHQYVTCVQWKDILSVNVVDFDVVVVNVRSLSTKVVKSFNHDFVEKVRLALTRLLDSGGQIIILGDARISVEVTKSRTYSNYEWSPIDVVTSTEAGTTITIVQDAFPRYFARFKKWAFYYSLGPLSWQLNQFYDDCQISYAVDQFIKNRYGRMLAGAWHLTVRSKTIAKKLGSFTLLPLIEDLEQREAVNLVLEDLLGQPQATLPPEWVEAIPMPVVPDIQADIDQKKAAIAALETEIAASEGAKRELEKFKKLLYATGKELEDIFAECLSKCGGKVTPATYSQEEFVLEYKRGLSLVECKGVGKSIALTHVRQLLDYMIKFEEDEGRAGKGILLGNAWKDLPPNERGQQTTVIFPDNAIARAAANDIALVSSVEFFNVFCRFIAGEVTGEAILDRITTGVGVVSFDDL